jgi:hypothetical protein
MDSAGPAQAGPDKSQPVAPADWKPNPDVLPACLSTVPPLPSQPTTAPAWKESQNARTGNLAATHVPTMALALPPSTWTRRSPGSSETVQWQAVSTAAPAVKPASGPVTPCAYETTGMVYFSDKGAEPTRSGSVTPDQIRYQLIQQIEKAGRGRLKDLEVVVVNPKAVVVRFKANNDIEGTQLARTVLRLPELVPYKVNLSVIVKP